MESMQALRVIRYRGRRVAVAVWVSSRVFYMAVLEAFGDGTGGMIGSILTRNWTGRVGG